MSGAYYFERKEGDIIMEDWFEWNGKKCTDFGMHVLSQPAIISPMERAEQQKIPGKSGVLTVLEGDCVYDNITPSCTCVIDDPYMMVEGATVSRIAAITGWLRGNGTIVFANRPEGYYKGRVANQISFEKAVQGNPHRLFSVQFQCEPFFYLESGDTEITLTDSALLENPGNVPSAPLLVISGTGDNATIMCGSSTMLIDFAGDNDPIESITLDCEAKIAYTGTGTPSDPFVLRGTRVTGEWLTIPVGSNYFVMSEEVTSAVITPKWRVI